MAARDLAYTPFADQVKEILRKQLANGWSAARIVVEMNRLGHENWTVSVVLGMTKDRFMSVDEAIGLLSIFRGHAQLLVREIDKMTASVAGKERAAHD